MSSNMTPSPFSRSASSTVRGFLPPNRFCVESAFGSHPICITRSPFCANAADRLEAVVDFPIPPFPYKAIFIILFFPFWHG